MQGLLDLLDLPYQGAGVLSSAICMDKRAAKALYRQNGLPVPRDVVVDRNRPINPEEIAADLGLPVVVKPACEGSSLGLTIAGTPEEVRAGLDDALACGRWAIVEEYLTGRELTVGVLGNDDLEALPVIEIIPNQEYRFFNYEAKYRPGASREICPADLSPELTRAAQELALKAHDVLYCRGYSRTDMMLKDGRLYLLETNTLPGMTATSLLPQAAAKAGYPFPKLLDRLIELALEDRKKK
jgi:D-alanine-D-alanine ligase